MPDISIPPNLQLIIGAILILLSVMGINPALIKKIKDFLTKYLFPKSPPKVIPDPPPDPDQDISPIKPLPEILVPEAHYQILRLMTFFSSRKDEVGTITSSSLGKHLYQEQQELLLNPPKTSPKRPKRPKPKNLKKLTSSPPILPTTAKL